MGITFLVVVYGPDSLGSKKVFLHSKIPSSVEGQYILSLTVEEKAIKGDLQYNANSCHCISSASEEPCMLDNDFDKPNSSLYELTLLSREIFGGIYVSSDSNDGEILMESLGKCCSCSSHGQMKACHGSEQGQNSVPNLLTTINGPWALIYWQASSRAIWFGRDAFGRRSLLVHWPTFTLLLTSVSPPHSIDKSSGVPLEQVFLRSSRDCIPLVFRVLAKLLQM
ncbi:hypothetical protein HYC85_020986 [Camellia sinensis]|uniref:Uncharacterized protein n=1 Tax=Camellia sinensis TaxID=4442 RepID=A0A7J7GGC1_CAMSI|nr:hypothetical protein HYC85_020986 [Camellia sinensis]